MRDAFRAAQVGALAVGQVGVCLTETRLPDVRDALAIITAAGSTIAPLFRAAQRFMSWSIREAEEISHVR